MHDIDRLKEMYKTNLNYNKVTKDTTKGSKCYYYAIILTFIFSVGLFYMALTGIRFPGIEQLPTWILFVSSITLLIVFFILRVLFRIVVSSHWLSIYKPRVEHEKYLEHDEATWGNNVCSSLMNRLIDIHRYEKVKLELKTMGYVVGKLEATEQMVETLSSNLEYEKTIRWETPALFAFVLFPIWGEVVSAEYSGKSGLDLIQPIFIMSYFALAIFLVARLVRSTILVNSIRDRELLNKVQLYVLELKK